MDRRLLRDNGRVAHVSLKGQVEAQSFVESTPQSVGWSELPIWNAPGGAIDRTLLFGDIFHVLEAGPGFAFGYAGHDGYVGYVDANGLFDLPGEITHRVKARLTQALDKPTLKTSGEHIPLSLNSGLHVTDDSDPKWAEIAMPTGRRFVPKVHLRPEAAPETDPVAVAERFLGTPYVWAGNHARGIDCSGLVQISCRACDIPCPGDSDQQEAALGETLTSGTLPKRGDLMFWKGHVAWVSDSETLLHANAFHMAVAYEPLNAAIARIKAQGDGPVTRHARLIAAR